MAEDTKNAMPIQQEEIKALQNNDEKLYEQFSILNNRTRLFNLKLRGLTEQVEGMADLTAYIYISLCIASLMNLEEGIMPMLTQAYRMGCRVNPSRLFP